MEQNSTLTRLHALDGIRGFAILFVLLNHVNGMYIGQIVPSWLGLILFGSGVTGVSLLFALSGFLMAYIYPNPASGLHFLQKRYTRIFPLFITSCVIMLALRELPNLIWYWQLCILVGFAFFSYFLWVHVIKRFASVQVKQFIFFGFILLQFFVGAFYLFWVMRHPAIVFNQQLPAFIREGTVGLVNATLTLPLGDYIPMLEGVYWSLVSEVLFYILYPFICVPLIHFFIPRKRWIKIVLLFSLIPFFAGMDILSHKIFILSMLQLPICFYFVTGIVLGYLFKKYEVKMTRIHKVVLPGIFSSITFLLFIVLIVSKLFILTLVAPSLISWIQMLWAFPITIAMAIALDHKTFISKILSSRVPVFLGTISYSVYLAHTPIIHIVESAYHAHSLLTNVSQLFLTLTLTLLVSLLWYQWLEKPYFKRNKVKETVKAFNYFGFAQFIRKPVFIFTTLGCIYLLAIFNAYQSNFNFFSAQVPFTNVVFSNSHTLPKQKNISMRQYPKVDFTLTSKENNLEIVTMHLTHDMISTVVDSPQWVTFRIKEVGQHNWYATDRFNLAHIHNDIPQPFGFPLIANAKGKSYQVELSVSDLNTSEYPSFDRSSLNGVYKINKADLLKHPVQLLQFFLNKMVAVLINQDAQVTFLLFLPLVLIILLLSSPLSFFMNACYYMKIRKR